MNQELIKILKSSWPGRTLQDLVTLYRWLEKRGKTIEDVEEYLKAGKRGPSDAAAQLWRAGGETGKRRNGAVLTEEKCPACKGRLISRPVKIPKGPANLYGHKWHKYCSGRGCIYEQYGGAGK